MNEQNVQVGLEEQFVTEADRVGMPWRLLVFATLVFGLTLMFFFGLKFGYGQYLDNQTKELDQKTESLARQVKTEDQQNFIRFYSQLINLKKALDRHIFASNIFNFLEKNTLGKVYYTKADYSMPENNTLSLNGQADSPETLVQQLDIFDKLPELRRVVLKQINFDPRATLFNIQLTFSENFFILPQ
jgi:hypothetical protein